MEVVTRFAPSPTGLLHLGAVRTAIFNFLYTKKNNGKFILRIEDTDQERSTKESLNQILESLSWLGIEYDQGPYVQSDRLEHYIGVAHALIDKGLAYKCFMTNQEVEELKIKAAKEKRVYKYPRTWRDRKDHPKNSPYVIRFKTPDNLNIEFVDTLRGKIKVESNNLDDFIIIRSDGYPTYNFSTAIDDAEMCITNVIRGEDHISNTPKQLLLYGSLGYPVPEFAHLPMILGPDKKRLSKRHGAAGIQEFRDAGYAADALLNYLVMLGWNPGTDQELFTREEMVTQFAIRKVQKKGAVYDEKKLHWIAGQHLAKVSEDEILQSIRSEDPNWQRHAKDEYIHHILKLMKVRAKTFNELKDMTGYFFSDPVTFDQEAAAKRWKDKSLNNLIDNYVQRLEDIANWSAADLEKVLRATAEDMAVSAAKLIHPVRLAVSGQSEGPGLFELLELLGKMTCIRRLRKALTIFPLTND